MQETYEEFIQNILDTRGRFNCGDEYHERHHIVPKCMGGSNDEENLIDLFANEHFIAHKLLALENPNNYRLAYAWTCMAFVKRNDTPRYELTPEEYEEARKALGIAMSGKVVSEETREKIRQAKLGTTLSDEVRQKMSESRKGENNPNYGNHKLAGENNPFYGKHHTDETKDKLRQNSLGTKLSDETKIKIRYALVGEKNPNFCKEFSEETKYKLSEAAKKRFENPKNHPLYGTHRSEETKQKLREKQLGKKTSGDTKMKISESSPIQTPIYCIELSMYFKGPAEAQKITGIKQQSIAECCKGRGSRKSAGRHPITNEKLHWIYVSKDEYLDNLNKKGNDINGTMEEE